MSLIRTARYLLVGTYEGTYGTDPSPTASEALNAWDISLNKLYNPQLVMPGNESVYSDMLPGHQYAELNFKVPLTITDTNASESYLSELLKACAYKHGSGTTNQFDTIGEYDSTNSSFYFYYYHDGVLEKLEGARGTATFHIETGLKPWVEFSFTGLYVSASAASIPSSPSYDETTSSVVKGDTLEIEATDYHSFLLEFSDNNSLAILRDANSTDGVYQIEHANSEPSGTVNVLVDTTNITTVEGYVENGTQCTVDWDSSVNSLQITLEVFFTGFERTDVDGILYYDMPFVVQGLTVINLSKPV